MGMKAADRKMLLTFARKIHVIFLNRRWAKYHREGIQPPDSVWEESIYRVLKDSLENEMQVSTFGKDGLDWLEYVNERINLRYSIRDLYKIQKTNRKRAVESLLVGSSDQYFRSVCLYRVENLCRITEETYRELGSPRKLIPYFNLDQLRKNRYFLALVRLDSLLLALGLDDEASARMYLDGVISRRVWKDQLPPVLNLASPLSLLDYLAFLRRSWLKRYSKNPEEAKKRHFSVSYHEKRCQEAVALADNLIYNGNPKQDSRYSLELFGAIGQYPAFVYYMYASDHIRKLVRGGIVGKVWPEALCALQDLVEEVEGNSKLWKKLNILEHTLNDKWRKSNIPDTRSDDWKKLHMVL